ncbi:MAG: 3-hydroxyacyl-ACP dehydratase [Bacteroidota bacterium]|nr:3-hydroxyacyl-ACP dehydratase [Bacteroidota bacterium]
MIKTSVNEVGFITRIELNAGHIVYSGHFPGHPVTPAVIQMQIVHELLEKHFCKNLKLITVSQCKFLKILNPIETSQVVIHIEYNRADELLDIKARGENGMDIFFKLNSSYQFI